MTPRFTSSIRLWLLLIWVPRIIWGIIMPPSWADHELNPCAAISWQQLQWPVDKRCYRIFSQGPCESQEELYFSQKHLRPLCRCAQGTVRHTTTNKCYRHYSRGPCLKGEYVAVPTQEKEKAKCFPYEKCEKGEIFWPKTRKCYNSLTQGPCAHGELIYSNITTGESQCGCSSRVMPTNYWSHEATCHEHSTAGPCIEGQIFRYNPSKRTTECVCGPHLATNYHKESNRCYAEGSVGPCGRGQIFKYDKKTRTTMCSCIESHVLWLSDNHCYREYTRGPCKPGYFLRTQGDANHGSCVKNLCSQGQLYDPGTNKCYYVGRRGPCQNGQLWIFEKASSVRGSCKCDEHLIGYWAPHNLCYEIGEKGPCDKRKVIEYDRSTGKVDCKCDQRRGYVSWIHGGCLRVGVSKRRLVPVAGPSRNSVGRNSALARVHRGLTLPSNTPSVNIQVTRRNRQAKPECSSAACQNEEARQNSRRPRFPLESRRRRRRKLASFERRRGTNLPGNVIRTSSSSTRVSVSTQTRDAHTQNQPQ